MGDFFNELGWKLLVAFAAGFIVSGWHVVMNWILYVNDLVQNRRALAPRYKGPIVFGAGKTQQIVFEPKKRGHAISGRLVFDNQEYRVNGQYSDEYLTFSYAAKDAANTSQGTATFRVFDDRLEGVIAYRSKGSLAVESVQGTLPAAY